MSCCVFLALSLLVLPLFSKGLLAPRQVSANSEDVDGIMVTWQAPERAASEVQQYVVEWRALHPVGSTQPPPSWLWVAPYNTSALISGTELFIFAIASYQVHICLGKLQTRTQNLAFNYMITGDDNGQ